MNTPLVAANRKPIESGSGFVDPSLLKTRIKFGSYQRMFGESTWASFGPSTFTKAAGIGCSKAQMPKNFESLPVTAERPRIHLSIASNVTSDFVIQAVS